jgi:hypothetical protein
MPLFSVKLPYKLKIKEQRKRCSSVSLVLIFQNITMNYYLMNKLAPIIELRTL